MAHNNSNNPFYGKTVMWIVTPAVIGLSILMTKLDKTVAPHREVLEGKVTVKKEAIATPPVEVPAVAQEDSANTPAPEGEVPVAE